ncbi:rod shape-determining protein RodA [Croceicoccus naphthovorans]|uniref:Peptidoglycan glycosyltransferase MrdB n=1 Tax=Croceicoccus naphthovorans TaxID=1348774 RepID=A0A0G3XFY2_9SPHN|nr:rod shape-determining protein RodA [Croceicoccus naphthovorans]AKM10087.1 rod shape-determining protein RodA [Croceicoccus naphthovorans]MBB3991193.1 rod shape determining protein RodA [Croceicoccus naphthovorans]
MSVLHTLPTTFGRQPWGVIVPLLLLVCFGASVLYSAAGGHWMPWAALHIVRFIVFLVMALVIARFSRDFVRFMTIPIYVMLCLLLMAVEAMGFVGGGSQRWLNLGFMTLQPSELMKPAIVLILARFYDMLPPGATREFRSLVVPGLLIGFPVGLVLLQPDLGTSLAIVFGAVIVMYLAGLPMIWFIACGIAGVIAIPILFFAALHPYQQQRVMTFLDPESDPLGTGYHITQSKIAIGSGGIFGKGFGNGTQSHLNYLPEPHTDFVFATMAEEWGIMGGLFVLFVFGILLRYGLRVARDAPDRFGRLMAAGLTATIFFYAAVNLMMVMGLAPVVGIPLPFMSHGGSSMMTIMICVGLIMATDRWGKRDVRGGFE